MRIKETKLVMLLFSISVFLYAFEQSLLIFLNFDSILKPYRVTLIMAVAIWFFLAPSRIGGLALPLTRFFFGIYAFGLILVLLKVTFSPVDIQLALDVALDQFVLFIFAFSFLVLAVSSIQRPEHLVHLAAIILFSAVLSSGIWYYGNMDLNVYRVSGFFRNPNHFAFLISISIIIATYFVTQSAGRLWVLTMLFAYIAASLFLLALSGSRSGVFSVIIGLVLFLYRHMSSSGKASGQRILISAFVLLVLLSASQYILDSGQLPTSVMNRFTAEQMQSGAGRSDLIRSGFIAAGDSFYMGMGMGQYITKHAFYTGQLSGQVYATLLEFDLGLHNEYLNLLTEFGIFTLLAYLAGLIAIWRGIRKFGIAFPKWRHLSNLVESLLLLDLIFSVSQSMYTFPYHWMLLGFGLSLINLKHRIYRAQEAVNTSTPAFQALQPIMSRD